MSELLECLTSSIPSADEAAERVRQYVKKIEALQNPPPTTPVSGKEAPEHIVWSTAEVVFRPDLFEHISWSGWLSQALDQQ